jgi:hypothetical protein
MNLDVMTRGLAKYGRTVVLRRLTGTARVPFDVTVRAAVWTGQDTVLIGNVLQTADKVLMTAREITAARWPGPPRHGDQVIYEDGRVTVVQGTVQLYPHPGGDTAIVLRALGGG